jgi:hypothetical protein
VSGGLITAAMEPVIHESNTEDYINGIIKRYPCEKGKFAALEIIVKNKFYYNELTEYVSRVVKHSSKLHDSDRCQIYRIKSDFYNCHVTIIIGSIDTCRSNPDPYGRCYYDGNEVYYFPSGYLTMVSETLIETNRPKRSLDVIYDKLST